MPSSSSHVSTHGLKLGSVKDQKWPVARKNFGMIEFEPSPLKLDEEARDRILAMPGVQAAFDSAKAQEALNPTDGEGVLLAEVPLGNAYFLESGTMRRFEVTKIQFWSNLEAAGQVLVHWPIWSEEEQEPSEPAPKKRKRQSTSQGVAANGEGRSADADEPVVAQESETIKNLHEQIRKLTKEKEEKDRALEETKKNLESCAAADAAKAAAVVMLEKTLKETRDELENVKKERKENETRQKQELQEKVKQLEECQKKRSIAEMVCNDLRKENEDLRKKVRKTEDKATADNQASAAASAELQPTVNNTRRELQRLETEHTTSASKKEQALRNKDQQLEQSQIADANSVNERSRALNVRDEKPVDVQKLKFNLELAKMNLARTQDSICKRVNYLKKKRIEAEAKWKTKFERATADNEAKVARIQEEHRREMNVAAKKISDLEKANEDLKKKTPKPQTKSNLGGSNSRAENVD